MRNLRLTSPRRPLAGLVSTLLLVLAPLACQKEPGPPSEEYEQARQRFSKLYGQKLDQAFLDPQMAEIEAQLDQVPSDSMDAQPAKELLKRIEEGRKRAQAAQQETEDAIASARQVDEFPTAPRGTTPEPPEPPAAAEAPDAGTPDAGVTAGPVEGTSASLLSGGYQGCFRRGERVDVAGRGMRDTWELADRYSCSQAYPRFSSQVVVVEDGRVLSVLPKSMLRLTFPDAGSPPNPGR